MKNIQPINWKGFTHQPKFSGLGLYGAFGLGLAFGAQYMSFAWKLGIVLFLVAFVNAIIKEIKSSNNEL